MEVIIYTYIMISLDDQFAIIYTGDILIRFCNSWLNVKRMEETIGTVVSKEEKICCMIIY